MDFLEEKLSEIFNKDSWEIKTLGEIITENIVLGDSKVTAQGRGGKFPAIAGKDIVDSEIFIDKCKVFVDEELANKKTLIKKGDLLVIVNGLNEKRSGKACAYLGEPDCIAGNDIAVIKHSQNSKYLAHLFSSQYVEKQMKLSCRGGAFAHIKKKDLLDIQLLLPDLETQNRIADFLDKFVYLKSELAFEKEKRRKGWNNLNIIGIRYLEEMRKKYFEKLEA